MSTRLLTHKELIWLIYSELVSFQVALHKDNFISLFTPKHRFNNPFLFSNSSNQDQSVETTTDFKVPDSPVKFHCSPHTLLSQLPTDMLNTKLLMVFGPGNGYRLRTIKAHYTVNAPFSEDYPEDAYSIILCWGPCCPWTLGGCNRSEAVVAGSENWTTSRPVVPDNLDDSSCGLVSL